MKESAMNNLVALLPQNESIEFRPKSKYSSNYYGRADSVYRNLYPYSTWPENLIKSIQDHHIKIPSKLIDRSMGTSVCPHCKTKYSGHQEFCMNTINWFLAAGEYRWGRGDLKVGDIVPAADRYSLPKKVNESGIDFCDQITIWNLEKEFQEQVEFFKFVELLGSLSPEKVGTFEKYRNNLPMGAADEYRIQLMENIIQNQLMQINQLQGAIRQIAEKMNAAGNNLSFGF